MGKLLIDNPSVAKLEKSYLVNDAASGAITFDVKNINNIAANDRLLVGEMGAERSEIVSVDSVSSQTVTLSSGFTFDHSADDPVYALRWDQIRIYRDTSKTGNFDTVLTTVDVDVDNATLQTAYDDTTGTSTNWYKVSYYHSVDTEESDKTDAIKATGWLRGTIGHAIDQFLREVRDETQQFITRQELIDWSNECDDELMTEVSKPYSFLKARRVAERTDSTNYVDYPTDDDGKQIIWKFSHIDHEYVSGSTDETYTIRRLPLEEFRNRFSDNTAGEDDKTQYYALDDHVNRIRLFPTPESTDSDAYYIYYWKYFDTIDSEGDTFETPNPNIYLAYWRWRYYLRKGETESSYIAIADRWAIEYQNEKAKLQSSEDKGKGTPRSFMPDQGYKGWREF